MKNRTDNEKNIKPESEGVESVNKQNADGVENADVAKKEENAEDIDKQCTDTPEDKIAKLEEEVNSKRDDYLRLAAEFDNYRRRVSKEKLDLITTASEGVLKGLLPIVDDFERAIVALKDSEDSDTAKEGTELIYKKLVEYLKNNGVKEIEALGKELDTDFHEAIAQIPSPDSKNKIIEVVQKGYLLGDKVIRFAKVVVGC